MDGYSCNLCHVKVLGIVYRTHCLHLYCPSCAKSTFRSRKCTVCQCNLSLDTVYEAAAGSEVGDVKEQMFQCLLSYSIDESHVAMDRLLEAIKDISKFIHVQDQIRFVQYRNLESAYQNKILEKEEILEQLKTQLTDDNNQLKHAVLSLEDQLNKRSTEVSQLEESLKDKIRKCQAWEKAYTNIRSQLITKEPLKSTYFDSIPSGSRNPSALEKEQESAPSKQSFLSIQTYRNIPRSQLHDAGLSEHFPFGAASNTNSIMKLLGQKRSISDAAQSAATSSDRRLELRKYLATGSGSEAAFKGAHHDPSEIIYHDDMHPHMSSMSHAFFDKR